jgi:hypothetical protein
VVALENSLLCSAITLQQCGDAGVDGFHGFTDVSHGGDVLPTWWAVVGAVLSPLVMVALVLLVY